MNYEKRSWETNHVMHENFRSMYMLLAGNDTADFDVVWHHGGCVL